MSADKDTPRVLTNYIAILELADGTIQRGYLCDTHQRALETLGGFVHYRTYGELKQAYVSQVDIPLR